MARTSEGPTRRRRRPWRFPQALPAALAANAERKDVSAPAALNGAFAILIIGLFAWLAGQPLVFAAAGPTAFVMFRKPLQREAAPLSILVGHLVAMACGLAAWQAVRVAAGPGVTETAGWPVFLVTMLALAVTCMLLVQFNCPHTPACATAALIGLGGIADVPGLLCLGLAVVTLAGQAFVVTRFAGAHMRAWYPRHTGRPRKAH